jgi:hypothetical protein
MPTQQFLSYIMPVHGENKLMMMRSDIQDDKFNIGTHRPWGKYFKIILIRNQQKKKILDAFGDANSAIFKLYHAGSWREQVNDDEVCFALDQEA